MPSRYLREGLLDSDRVASLTDAQERLYTRLILVSDDAGRFDARPAVVAAKAFPLAAPALDEISARLRAIEAAKLLVLYEVWDKPVGQLRNVRRCGNSEVSRFPWMDGSYTVSYIKRETRDGLVAFVASSLDLRDTDVLDDAGRAGGDKSPPRPNYATLSDNDLLVVADYADLHNSGSDPILLAISLTEERAKRAWGHWVKALQLLQQQYGADRGEKAFRRCLCDLFGEMKAGEVEKPGAILNLKLSQVMSGKRRVA